MKYIFLLVLNESYIFGYINDRKMSHNDSIFQASCNESSNNNISKTINESPNNDISLERKRISDTKYFKIF